MSATEKIFEFDGKKIIIIGTAHISEESVKEVREKIASEKPDFVAIELDEGRLATLKNPDSWKNLDIVKVLKTGKGFLLLTNIILSSFQKRMGQNVGVKPGDEMRAGIDEAEKLGIPTVMVDRAIQTTLSRAWAKNSLIGKSKLLATLISSAFSKEEISADEIEKLKNSNEMDSMMTEISDYLPSVKSVLIDERDQFLASKIFDTAQKKENCRVLAVLGAGHLPGVLRNLEKLSRGEQSSDTSEIEKMPPKTIWGKVAGIFFPLLIIGLIVAGFFTGGLSKSREMLLQWLVFNSSLAFLGSLIAAAHPLTLLTAIVTAPIGTLSPVLSVGIFAGIVEAIVKKPRVKDLETISDDCASVKGFYKNRVLHVLLIFILSSLGGAIGNFISFPTLFAKLFG